MYAHTAKLLLVCLNSHSFGVRFHLNRELHSIIIHLMTWLEVREDEKRINAYLWLLILLLKLCTSSDIARSLYVKSKTILSGCVCSDRHLP